MKGNKRFLPKFQIKTLLNINTKYLLNFQNDSPIGNATLGELRDSKKLLAQTLTTQANREVVAPANPIGGIGASRVRKFLKTHRSSMAPRWKKIQMGS